MLSEKLYILNESDLYKIMGIEITSEIEKISATYRLLAKTFHPDVIKVNNESEREKAKQVFTKITTAYNTLKDPDKRKRYDYERILKLEYEKTILNSQLQNQGFTFTSPVVTPKKNTNNSGGFTVGIKINPSTATPPTNSPPKSSNFQPPNIPNQQKQPPTQKGKADEETINAHSEALYNVALSKLSNKDHNGAIMDLQTAIVINAKVAKYHSCLGLIMKEKGWDSYSHAEFKKALNIDPQDKIALKYCGNTSEMKVELNKGIIKEKVNTAKLPTHEQLNKASKNMSLLDLIKFLLKKIFFYKI